MEDQLKPYHQDSLSKHVTIRAHQNGDAPDQLAIDQAIDHGLDILSNNAGQQMHLMSAIPIFRSDDSIFVTIVAAPMVVSEECEEVRIRSRER